MKTLKFGFCCLFVFVATFFATPSFAGNIADENPSISVREQLAKMIQNPQLQENGLTEADLYLQFTVKADGEILLLAINTDNDYLINFAKEKLHHQKIDTNDFTPNAVYNLRIKFELQ